MTQEMQEIIQRLKDAIEKSNLSYSQLERLTGIAKSSIQRYATGQTKKIPIDNLKSIAAACGVSAEYLLGWDEQKETGSAPGTFPYKPTHRIPVLGRVAAGLPLYAEENIEGYILTELNGGAEYFGLRIIGDSMNAARIQDGDIVVVRKQDVVENGEIAIVLVGDSDATVKKFIRTGNIVHLIPVSTNPAHEVQEYDLRDTSVKILGKVVRVQFDM